MKEEIKQFIVGQLLNERHADTIGDGDDLLGSGLVDSVGMTSLVIFIENTLNIEVPAEDVTIDNFLSLSAIEAYLENRGALG